MKELATRQLTDMQAAFVLHLAETGDESLSAAMAGSTRANPAHAAREMLALPHVLAALHIEVRKRIVSLAPLALSVVQKIVEDPLGNAKTRLDAAKILLERAGFVAPKPAAERPADVPLHEMTVEKLRELAGRLEDEIAGRAKDVSSAIAAPAGAEHVDLVG